MNATATIDTTGLNARLGELHEAMLAYGEDKPFRSLLRDQAGILAKEISVQLGPKTQAKGAQKIVKAVSAAFVEVTVPAFPQAKRGGRNGPLQFLFATKAAGGYLVGAKGSDFVTSTLSADQLIRQSRRPRGVKWVQSGYRGGRKSNQMLIHLNRMLVQRGRKAELLRRLKDRIGRMRATFAYAAHALGRTDTPGWVSRHFSDVRSAGRAIFDMGKLKDKNNPEIAFGSRAPGIDNFAGVIDDALALRSRKVADRTAAILKAIGRREAAAYQPEP